MKLLVGFVFLLFMVWISYFVHPKKESQPKPEKYHDPGEGSLLKLSGAYERDR